MHTFYRVLPGRDSNFRVLCLGCGKMFPYDEAFIARDCPFAYFHEGCVPRQEDGFHCRACRITLVHDEDELCPECATDRADYRGRD
jgi:hypothetical protein